MSQAQVTLTDQPTALAAALLRTTQTDATGDYRFDDVPAAAYTLTVALAGFVAPAPDLGVGDGRPHRSRGAAGPHRAAGPDLSALCQRRGETDRWAQRAPSRGKPPQWLFLPAILR